MQGVQCLIAKTITSQLQSVNTRQSTQFTVHSLTPMNIDAVGSAFVQHYYQTFDKSRASLAALYVRKQKIINNLKPFYFFNTKVL